MSDILVLIASTLFGQLQYRVAIPVSHYTIPLVALNESQVATIPFKVTCNLHSQEWETVTHTGLLYLIVSKVLASPQEGPSCLLRKSCLHCSKGTVS